MPHSLLLPKALESVAYALGNMQITETKLDALGTEFWDLGYTEASDDRERLREMRRLLAAASRSNEANVMFAALAAYEAPLEEIQSKVTLYTEAVETKTRERMKLMS